MRTARQSFAPWETFGVRGETLQPCRRYPSIGLNVEGAFAATTGPARSDISGEAVKLKFRNPAPFFWAAQILVTKVV